MASFTCWNCGEKDHPKRDCPHPKKKDGKSKNNDKQEDNDNSSIYLASNEIEEALVLSVDSSIELCILNSGALFHSSPMRELFHDFEGKVYLVDDKMLAIMAKGDVVVRTVNKGTLKLQDVRYIIGLAKNMISVSQLDSYG